LYLVGESYLRCVQKSLNQTNVYATYSIAFTTPLNSFTDGLIQSVTEMNSVGAIITNGPRPSV
jgi:hypothetical protein